MVKPSLSPEELQRYSRHLMLPEVGVEGQLRLKQASVLTLGAGGLGAPVAMYLAAAGIGRLGLCDFDRVEPSNLQRQILHSTADVGRSKLESARDTLHGINPHVELSLHEEALSPDNALELFARYDIIVDGTDNFPTRYLANDAALITHKPYVYGAIFRFEGQASVFGVPGQPCYRCLFPEPPAPGTAPNCAEAGVLGVLPGLIGTIQATEAIKLALGAGESLAGKLLLCDAWAMRFRTVMIQAEPSCAACGPNATLTALGDYAAWCGTPPSAERAAPNEISCPEAASLAEPVWVDVREHHEWVICHLPGAVHLPLGDLEGRAGELPRERQLIAYCHHGLRSAQAVAILQSLGFQDVWSLEGGIDAWSRQVDPSLPRY